MITELEEHLASYYSEEHRHGYSVAKLLAEAVAFFVLRADDVAAGCGGIQLFGTAYGELKRMYVRPQARSRGVGRALLAALEEAAVSLGYVAARLDTGPKQVHGLELYRSAGYVDVEPYNDNPFACFWGEKRLA